MSKKRIQIKFSHVLHESNLPGKERREISKKLNEILQQIKDEIISSEGVVKVIELKNGSFSFLSECNDEQVKDKMNELISNSMLKLKIE